MSESTASVKCQLWEKMHSKEYRDSFVAAHLTTNIAAQIQTLRENRNWTQKELGEKSGMTQARISRLEDPSYEGYTLSTLKRLASAFDVAFIARFEFFSNLISWVSDISPAKLSIPSFESDRIATVKRSVDHAAAAGHVSIQQPQFCRTETKSLPPVPPAQWAGLASQPTLQTASLQSASVEAMSPSYRSVAYRTPSLGGLI